jgi:hypothetical protein
MNRLKRLKEETAKQELVVPQEEDKDKTKKVKKEKKDGKEGKEQPKEKKSKPVKKQSGTAA